MAARACGMFSRCVPASTTAIEFNDGKLMLGQMRSFDEITCKKLIATLGVDELVRQFANIDLLAFVNWTMVPNMTGIYQGVLKDILPALP